METTPSALAWGWPVWGCAQKFAPYFTFSLNLIPFPKNSRILSPWWLPITSTPVTGRHEKEKGRLLVCYIFRMLNNERSTTANVDDNTDRSNRWVKRFVHKYDRFGQFAKFANGPLRFFTTEEVAVICMHSITKKWKVCNCGQQAIYMELLF